MTLGAGADRTITGREPRYVERIPDLEDLWLDAP
jgi:hypothetical protein